MRVLLRLPATPLDWDAASDYIENAIATEQLLELAEWFVLREEDLTPEPEPELVDDGARLRGVLRDALKELRAAVEGTRPYDRRPSSDAERRTFHDAAVLAGHVTHADNSITDIYTAIHHLHCGGVLAVLGCEREG